GGPFVYGQLDVKPWLAALLPPGTPGGTLDSLLGLSTAPDGGPGLLDLNGRAARLVTEYSFQCPAALLAADSHAVGIPVWRYLYNASFPNTDIYPGSGAYHSADVKTLFGTFPGPGATPFQTRLHLAMQSAWAAFAKDPTRGPGWDPAPDALAILGGGATPHVPDDGRQPISVVSPDAIDRRCALYSGFYAAALQLSRLRR
ncbi:hypothetical protein E4U53_000900, partial [Claviceps sorghi]